MKKEIQICFVCSENISRSLIAEFCFNEYAKLNNLHGLKAISAGTDAKAPLNEDYTYAHLDELEKMGIDARKHKRTQLTQKIIDQSDLVVAMAEYHQEWIREKFNIKVPMFSEIINGKKISFHIPPPDTKECEIVLRKIVHEIYDSMPIFVKNMKEFIK